MKKGIQLILLLFILFLATNCTKNGNQNHIFYDKSYKDEIVETHKEMGYFLSANFIPGASIAIMKNGKLVYSEAMGTASKDLDVNVNRNTKFRIGTLSEIFTALMFVKMEETGLLHSDSTVQKYYPAFPEKEYPIMLKHLVQHTSGIRTINYKEESWRALNVSMEKAIGNIHNDPLLSPPGSTQNESVWNYNLLGVVMQKATKQPYRKLLEQYITDTLQLNNTVIDHPLIQIKDRSNFYDNNVISQVVNATSVDLRYCASSSGILSSSEDLVKLGMQIISSDYFSEANRKEIFEQLVFDDGYPAMLTHGWNVLDGPNGNNAYARLGSVNGGSAAILLYPEEELVIACCTNLTKSTSNLPLLKIAGLFLPEQQKTNAD